MTTEENEASSQNKKNKMNIGNLDELRSGIDATDRKIVQLLLDRSDLVKKVGLAKQSSGTTIYRPDREKQVYQNLHKIIKELSKDKPSMPIEVFEHIYREIMSGSIALEGGPAVAYLGPEASFSHQATRNKFGASLRLKPVDSIEDIFSAVELGQDVTFGVVPVENTIAGTVGQTFDKLLNTSLKIYAEHFICVEMNLLYKGKVKLEKIKKLYTLKIVYDQCRDWIASHLNTRNLQIVETSSTAVAAQLASKNKDGAALASSFAAKTYKLRILEKNIQDTPHNITRFFVLGNEQCPPTGDDKTSILCTIADNPGSLYNILKPFEKNNINLTRIKSRTTRRVLGEYHFFIDFEGHKEDVIISQILKEISASTNMLKILGSYPRINPPV